MQRIAIAIVEWDNRFLIGRRPEGVPLAGYWEFPGGKVLSGESSAEAAVRECLEETGLRVEIVSFFADVSHEYDHGRLQLDFHLCRPCNPECTPRSPFQWVLRAQLAEFDFPEANQSVIVDEVPPLMTP